MRESARKVSGLPETEVRKLMHGLQVHQMEIELQNEELRHARLELESTRNRFLTLYDFAPAGYVTLDGQGITREANLTAAVLLGVDRAETDWQEIRQFYRSQGPGYFSSAPAEGRDR